MANEESTTLQNILAAGKEEFLEKGFKSASLRNIVKTAGVTTGAFYGYFSGKEALFAALVEEHATAIMNIFMSAQEDFEMLDEKDLQAIQKMIDASEERTRRYMNVLIESDVTPKFNLLADGIKDIQEKLVPRSRVDDLEDEVKFLKLMYRQMAERVASLEKAN